MRRAALLLVLSATLLVLSATSAFSQDFSLTQLQGLWTGTLNEGILNLRVAIRFDKNGTGKLDSLDQHVTGIPVTGVRVQGYRVIFRVDSVEGSFSGIVLDDGNRLDGDWYQGVSLPFVLTRDGVMPKIKRPQTPKPPFPYTEQDIKFPSFARNVFLDATLTIPEGSGPFPGVVLITGSGPQDRDESNLGHKPFWVIADYLARRGVVVLRADDRGTGKSTGIFNGSTTPRGLRRRCGWRGALSAYPGIRRPNWFDRTQRRRAGGSHGGERPGAGREGCGFSGVAGSRLACLAIRSLSSSRFWLAALWGCFRNRRRTKNRERESRKFCSVARSETDPVIAKAKMRAALGEFGGGPMSLLNSRFDEATTPWFRFLINYDPGPALRALKQPVLALNGALDVQVPPAQNLPAITWELEAGDNKDYEVVKLAGLNHFFQTATTGAPSEYGEIEETIAPSVLNLMAEWITRHSKAKEKARPVLGGTVPLRD